MLDVHPPHAAAHSWKDFLVHIATISIGLLIAIGLEQTVEWLHHRHQLREAREQLGLELKENRAVLQYDLDQVRKVETELERDIEILRQHQSSQSPVTEKLDYSWTFYRFPDAAWQAAKGGNYSPHDFDGLIAATADARGRLAFTSFLLGVTAHRIQEAVPPR